MRVAPEPSPLPSRVNNDDVDVVRSKARPRKISSDHAARNFTETSDEASQVPEASSSFQQGHHHASTTSTTTPMCFEDDNHTSRDNTSTRSIDLLHNNNNNHSTSSHSSTSRSSLFGSTSTLESISSTIPTNAQLRAPSKAVVTPSPLKAPPAAPLKAGAALQAPALPREFFRCQPNAEAEPQEQSQGPQDATDGGRRANERLEAMNQPSASRTPQPKPLTPLLREERMAPEASAIVTPGGSRKATREEHPPPPHNPTPSPVAHSSKQPPPKSLLRQGRFSPSGITLQTPSSEKKTSSILRPGRFSPGTPASPSPNGTKPSTGQRVRGLWSPSVVKVVAGTELVEQHALPALPGAVSPAIETLRNETLARIFCHLDLADLLRASRVSRRWQHEIEARRSVRRTTRAKGGEASTNTLPLVLWERVDASSFVRESYDRFLGVAQQRKQREEQESKREQQQQQQEQQELPQASEPLGEEESQIPQQELSQEGLPATVTPNRTRLTESSPSLSSRTKSKPKPKPIRDCHKWARLQTGRALGRALLRSKTSAKSISNTPAHLLQAEGTTARPPLPIQSLVLRGIGHRLSPDHLDDFLPSQILSNLRELTLQDFEGLNDTHVHVLLLASSTSYHHPKLLRRPATPRMPPTGLLSGRNSHTSGSKLEVLALEDCPLLTHKVLSSVATTTGKQSKLTKLSIRGCSGIDSIAALSDLLVTKLALPEGSSSGEAKPGGAEESLGDSPLKPRAEAPPPSAQDASPAATGVTSLFAPPPEPQRQAKPVQAKGLSSLFAPPPKPVPSAGLSTLFAPPPSPPKPVPAAGLSSLFAPPPQSTNTPSKPVEKFAPPKASSKPAGLDALFAPPPAQLKKASDSGAEKPSTKQEQRLSSLFAPPPPPVHDPTPISPATSTRQRNSSSSSSASPPSKSSLASLFDIPGTSPTRQNHAESMRILPPPPPCLSTVAGIPAPSPSLSQSGSGSRDNSPGATSYKRYHQHRRSLSNGKLPFPSALLPPQGSSTNHSPSNTLAPPRSERRLQQRRASMVVGSLKSLDIRGTGVTPKSLVDCLWTLTHHHHNLQNSSDAEDRSWCKVWFEALHLDGSESNNGSNESETPDAKQDSVPLLHHRWTVKDLERLESVLAMDEMKRKRLRSHNNSRSTTTTVTSNGISYLSSKEQR